MNVGTSLIATVVSLAFALVVYRQYVSRLRPYQLVWSMALLIFALGTFCQFVAEQHGWSDSIYRVWYYTGAMLAAAYFGQGTVYLIAPRALAHGSMAVLVALSLEGLGLAMTVPVNMTSALDHGAITGNGFPLFMLFFLIPLNTYGTVALVGGALWSVVKLWPKPPLRRRALGTLLIAVGGIVVALGGTADRLGVPGLLYLTELLGVVIIFVGYLQTVVQSHAAPASVPTTQIGGEPAQSTSVRP